MYCKVLSIFHIVSFNINGIFVKIEAPELGGATVFPRIGARIEPISRSAVLWYNLHPSLNGDIRTLHAGCPVLVGSKWVSNLWIRANGQVFRRPCDLVKEDAFEI